MRSASICAPHGGYIYYLYCIIWPYKYEAPYPERIEYVGERIEYVGERAIQPYRQTSSRARHDIN